MPALRARKATAQVADGDSSRLTRPLIHPFLS
jgi:hypothetical protein